MGVKGLTTFVNDHHRVLLEDYQLHSTKLVIDGLGLMNMFYTHNIDPGNRSEFQKFYAKIATFFCNLKSCGIEPFVVLDGGYDVDGKKRKTHWKTSQSKLDRLKLINEGKHATLCPPMTSEVFKRVMHDFGIHFVFVSFEADKDVAVLANQLQCPVLGSDSDFYIMNIHQGYIPLDTLNWGKLLKMPKYKSWGYEFFLSCRRYKIGKFCKIFHIQPCLMPLFASLCGNDYLETWPSNLDKVIASLDASAGLSSGNLTFIPPSWQSDQRQLIEKLLNLLSHFSTHGECFHEISRQTNTEEEAKVRRHGLLMSCGMYDVTKPTTVIDFFLGGDKQLLKHPLVKEFSLPVHFVKLFEVGSIPKMALNVLLSQIHFFRPQIENLSELPSITCCMSLIRIMSGIMLQGVIDVCNNEQRTTEALKVDIPCREGHTLQSNYVDPMYEIPNYGKVPSFREIPGISKQQRLAILTASLNVKDVHLGNAPKSFSLVLLITIYWFRNANPSVSQHHLCSLMLGWVQGVAWLQNNRKHIPRHNFEGLELDYCWDDNEIGCILQNFEPFSRQNLCYGNTPDLDVSHAFAQWLDCVRITHYLNQLLLEVYPPPEMTVFFNGVLVHNICFELKTTKPLAYKKWIEGNLLVGGPNANKLFSALKIFFSRHLELQWQW